jgi:hypothetical protein
MRYWPNPAHQLWNGGWLSSPVVRDELIDQFAQAG